MEEYPAGRCLHCDSDLRETTNQAISLATEP